MSRFNEYLEAYTASEKPKTLSARIDKFMKEQNVRFCRKPTDYQELDQKIYTLDLEDLDAYSEDEDQQSELDMFLDMIGNLQMFTPVELWGQGKYKLFNNFSTPTNQFFILNNNDDYYLVNTEGGDYVRYALKLENYDTFM